MQQPKATSNWFFVDESGDPIFYDKKGNFIVGYGSVEVLVAQIADPVVQAADFEWIRVAVDAVALKAHHLYKVAQ